MKAFDSTHRGKMEQILLAYVLPKETVTAMMLLYSNKVCSLDGDADFSDIVAGVLQGDTLTPYFFIICLDYVLQTLIDLMKENDFKLKKGQETDYTPQKLLQTQDYADDIALLANILTQAASLLHCLEQAAGGIGLHVNVHKTEYMCFNHKRDIATLNGGSLKFMYLNSSNSSTEYDINMH